MADLADKRRQTGSDTITPGFSRNRRPQDVDTVTVERGRTAVAKGGERDVIAFFQRLRPASDGVLDVVRTATERFIVCIHGLSLRLDRMLLVSSVSVGRWLNKKDQTQRRMSSVRKQ